MFDEILTRLRHNPLFDEYYNIQAEIDLGLNQAETVSLKLTNQVQNRS